MDRTGEHRDFEGEQDFPTTRQILEEAESAERLIERLNMNEFYVVDEDEFYDSKEYIGPENQDEGEIRGENTERRVIERKNNRIKSNHHSENFRYPVNGREKKQENGNRRYDMPEEERRRHRSTITDRIGITHVAPFIGTGNEFERIRDLGILFQELEDFYLNRDLSEEDKLALLKQKLAPEPKRAILEDRPATYNQAKRILLKDYTPEVKGENIAAKIKQVKKKGEEKFIRYAKRVISHARIMADKLDLTIEHELIFIPITDALLQHFPNHVTSSDAVIRARRHRDIETMLEVLEDIAIDRPEWWNEQKGISKIRTANATEYEEIGNKIQNAGNKNIEISEQTKEENIKEKERKNCTYCNKPYHSEEQCWIKYPEKGPRNWRRWEDGQRRRGFNHYSDKNNWNRSYHQNHYGGRNNDMMDGTVDNNMRPEKYDNRRNEHHQGNRNQLKNF